LQGILEPSQLPVISGDIVPDVQGPLMVHPECRLELRQYVQIQFKCLMKLAARTKVAAVEAFAVEEDLESITIGIPPQQGPDPHYQLMRVSCVTTEVHGVGYLN